MPQLHIACIDAREAIHILRRLDGIDDLILVNLLRQRQLDDIAINVGVVVQELDHLEHFLLCGSHGKTIHRRGHAHRLAGFLF